VQKYGAPTVQTRQRTHEVLQRGATRSQLMAAELKPKLTFDEYLEIEGKAEFIPTALVEVLSTSTEDVDRDTKIEEYRSVPSLREYLLIAQDRCHVEHYVRQTINQWLLTEFNDLQNTLHPPSINCHLALSDVYDKLKWPEAE